MPSRQGNLGISSRVLAIPQSPVGFTDDHFPSRSPRCIEAGAGTASTHVTLSGAASEGAESKGPPIQRGDLLRVSRPHSGGDLSTRSSDSLAQGDMLAESPPSLRVFGTPRGVPGSPRSPRAYSATPGVPSLMFFSHARSGNRSRREKRQGGQPRATAFRCGYPGNEAGRRRANGGPEGRCCGRPQPWHQPRPYPEP